MEDRFRPLVLVSGMELGGVFYVCLPSFPETRSTASAARPYTPGACRARRGSGGADRLIPMFYVSHCLLMKQAVKIYPCKP